MERTTEKASRHLPAGCTAVAMSLQGHVGQPIHPTRCREVRHLAIARGSFGAGHFGTCTLSTGAVRNSSAHLRGCIVTTRAGVGVQRDDQRLLLVTLPLESIAKLMDDADDPSGNTIQIDITERALRSRSVQASFELMPRHWRMFLEGLDNIGLSLTHRNRVDTFARDHRARQPWLGDVAAMTVRSADDK